jgi:hypothetical protein
MTLAIMQPYFFPYLGYFKLIQQSQTFVYLDDVNYIKQGWVHRNRILVNKQPLWISLSLTNASQNRKINEIDIFFEDKIREKILKTIQMNYKKAPFFDETFDLVQRLISYEDKNLANFLIYSTTEIAKSLKMETLFRRASELMDTSTLRAQEKILAICKQFDTKDYINAPGGRELYDEKFFTEQGIRLSFVDVKLAEYKHFADPFVPGLSIIDVLMHNGFDKTKELIDA